MRMLVGWSLCFLSLTGPEFWNAYFAAVLGGNAFGYAGWGVCIALWLCGFGMFVKGWAFLARGLR